MSKVILIKCGFCNGYPHLLKVGNEYKYMCCWENPRGKSGYWYHTKNGARRAWNKRSKGVEYA